MSSLQQTSKISFIHSDDFTIEEFTVEQFTVEEVENTTILTFEEKRDIALERFKAWAQRLYENLPYGYASYFHYNIRLDYETQIGNSQHWEGLITIFDSAKKTTISTYSSYLSDKPLEILQELDTLVKTFIEEHK